MTKAGKILKNVIRGRQKLGTLHPTVSLRSHKDLSNHASHIFLNEIEPKDFDTVAREFPRKLKKKIPFFFSEDL